MYYVSPKLDCPHHRDVDVTAFRGSFDLDKLASACSLCPASENWLCLSCGSVFCSRYEQGHMSAHFAEQGHAVALSFSDGSFWCYECDSYVYSPVLKDIALHFSAVKFPEDNTEASLLPLLATITTTEAGFSRAQLIEGLSSFKFHKIAVLTGAGISVAAGIPDFRTPKIGLYAKVAELGMSRPEDIFSINFFQDDPKPFYSIAKTFLLNDNHYHPVKAHKFIKKLDDRGQLMMNYTQNIDGLELKAGLPLEKLIQAHGHMRTAACYQCKKEYDIELFRTHVEEERVLFCDECQGGIVKPDIVFFGEKLPERFMEHFYNIGDADLVIAMGSSFKVFPFAFLLQCLPEKTPVVMINRDNPGIDRENFLFLQGDIEERITELCDEMAWIL